jgi:hypothetical protein
MDLGLETRIVDDVRVTRGSTVSAALYAGGLLGGQESLAVL